MEAVSISPDGSLLVTGGRDGLLILMNLQIPSVLPVTDSGNTKVTLSATVRHSCEVLEESLKHLNPPEEISHTEEDLSEATEADIQNEPKQRIRYDDIMSENKPDLDAGRVIQRRISGSNERRIKEKVVDIPTMIAHLSARASFIEEPSSSSGESSDYDSEEDTEGQFQVKPAHSVLNQKDTVMEIMESNKHPPLPSQLSLLPDETQRRSKKRVNLFERKERDSSAVDDADGMDNVVLLMKNFLDDNKPDEVAHNDDVKGHEIGQEYSIPVSGLVPGEREGDFMLKDLSDRESLPGLFSFSLEHPNSGVDFNLEQLPSVPMAHLSDNFFPHISSRHQESLQDQPFVSVRKNANGKKLGRHSTNQSNEYGDEVPLSMI